jgi:hypothetical protein
VEHDDKPSKFGDVNGKSWEYDSNDWEYSGEIIWKCGYNGN